jgi:hypothetical protein
MIFTPITQTRITVWHHLHEDQVAGPSSLNQGRVEYRLELGEGSPILIPVWGYRCPTPLQMRLGRVKGGSRWCRGCAQGRTLPTASPQAPRSRLEIIFKPKSSEALEGGLAYAVFILILGCAERKARDDGAAKYAKICQH